MSESATVFISGFLPFLALSYVVLVPLFSDFDVATRTHCGNKNVLPSVSSAIGYSQQTTTLWFLLISIHTPFRFKLASCLNAIYRKLLAQIYSGEFLVGLGLQELRHLRCLERLVKWSYWCNCLEIAGLFVLSVFTSTNDFATHRHGFEMYLLGGTGFTLTSCLIERGLLQRNMVNECFKGGGLVNWCFVFYCVVWGFGGKLHFSF
jgi:hypothetical protein